MASYSHIGSQVCGTPQGQPVRVAHTSVLSQGIGVQTVAFSVMWRAVRPTRRAQHTPGPRQLACARGRATSLVASPASLAAMRLARRREERGRVTTHKIKSRGRTVNSRICPFHFRANVAHDVAPACGLRGWSSGAAGRAGRAASSKRRQRRKMSADDMCAPCVQAPKGRDPLQELTEKTAASEAELREIKYARMYCDKGVPRYTLLRQSWYVNRKRRSFEEDDVMTCMCDEDQGCGPGCMNRCAPLVACRARATGVCSLSLSLSLNSLSAAPCPARSEMMYECLADECKVPGCQNQRFRRRQYAKLEVFPTPGKGYGLRCATGERARATAVPRPRKVALDC